MCRGRGERRAATGMSPRGPPCDRRWAASRWGRQGDGDGRAALARGGVGVARAVQGRAFRRRRGRPRTCRRGAGRARGWQARPKRQGLAHRDAGGACPSPGGDLPAKRPRPSPRRPCQRETLPVTDPEGASLPVIRAASTPSGHGELSLQVTVFDANVASSVLESTDGAALVREHARLGLPPVPTPPQDWRDGGAECRADGRRDRVDRVQHGRREQPSPLPGPGGNPAPAPHRLRNPRAALPPEPPRPRPRRRAR